MQGLYVLTLAHNTDYVSIMCNLPYLMSHLWKEETQTANAGDGALWTDGALGIERVLWTDRAQGTDGALRT